MHNPVFKRMFDMCTVSTNLHMQNGTCFFESLGITNQYTSYHSLRFRIRATVDVLYRVYFNPFIHYCSHVVTKFNARVIYTYGI
jgi:hypothetical protein